MLKLSTKCWIISTFNAEGSRGIIVAVQVGAVKKTGWNWGKSFTPSWMLMYFFAGFFWISPCVWPNSGYWCCLFLTLWISLLYVEVSNHNLMRQVHLPSYTGLKLLEQGCLSEWKASLNSLQGEELNREFPYAKKSTKTFCAQIFMSKNWHV
jgi:magnesium-transporting ATPase (P-type)